MSSNDKKNVIAFDAKKKPAKKINWIMIGSIIILVLSAIVFVLVPALSGFAKVDTESPVIGSYKGEEIKYEQNSDFLNYMSQYYQQYKDSGYDPEQYMYSIINSSFNTTVVSMAINRFVDDSKYIVPESAVNKMMRSYFADENGNYSPKAYNEADRATVNRLFEATEKELRTERYFADYIGMGGGAYYGASEYLYGTKFASKEADFVASLNEDKRQFQLVGINMLNLPDEEYLEFAKKNPSLFETSDYSICSAETEENMKDIANLIKNNQITFDDAISSMSSYAYDSYDGKLSLYDYQIKESLLADPNDYDDFKALGVGDISTIVHTQQGYAIFRRNAASKPADLTDPAVQEIVAAYVRVYEKGYIEDYYMDQAKDFAVIAARDGFEETAEAYGLEIVEPTAFPCNYGNDAVLTTIPTSQFAELTGAETNNTFLKTAFGLKLGEISSPILLDDYVVVLKYKESIPKDDAVAASMKTMYPYYASSYAQEGIQNSILTSEDVTNNALSFYLKYFMSYGN